MPVAFQNKQIRDKTMTTFQQIKNQVKRMFREFYTFQTIKMVFPDYDLRKKASWIKILGILADKLDSKLWGESTRREQNQAAVNGLDYAMSRVTTKISKSSEDFLGVYSAKLSYQDELGNWQKLGTVVFNPVSRQWHFGANGRVRYFNCAELILNQLQAIWDANEARKSLFAA